MHGCLGARVGRCWLCNRGGAAGNTGRWLLITPLVTGRCDALDAMAFAVRVAAGRPDAAEVGSLCLGLS